MDQVELWHRPWARLGTEGRDYGFLGAHGLRGGAGPIWLCTDAPAGPVVDGRTGLGAELFGLADGRRVYAMPIPPRISAGMAVVSGGAARLLHFANVPDHPPANLVATTAPQGAAIALLDRVKAVWTRLREVESALADPATIWLRLAALWMAEESTATPEMDIIVDHARRLSRTLDLLDRAPRRILRRTHRLLPLPRVQEIDRRAMTWLVRQPGETMAERAGGRQRINAITREENFDTLENRVVLSYARLAAAIARDYESNHTRAAASVRVRLVVGFGKRCRQLAADFAARGVGEAPAGVTPNFVLQNNANYHQVWDGWIKLLQRERILDELWRWQARSWEEFCALALVVAVQAIDGARPIATSPLVFGVEQTQGRWLEHVNPLAVFHLPAQGVIVEVSYGTPSRELLRHFGAEIWLRFGRIGDNSFLSRWAVWPIWHAQGGIDASDVEAIAPLLPAGRAESVRGGLTIRPAVAGEDAELRTGDHAACLTLAPSGPALAGGITRLSRFLADTVLGGAG